MSQILSYNNKTTKTANQDWTPVTPYVDDDIKRIKDPTGGLSVNPRTAIPSPFAQLDLVKNAFAHLAANADLDGTLMDKRLVSNALDVAQLFFDFENHASYLHIVRWNRTEQLARLKSEADHRLYGDTLELFLNSDAKYNFDALTDWYILVWNSQVIGGTSPSSLTLAVPREKETPIDDIKVEQGVSLFAEATRDLWERDEDFVYYLFLLFNAFPVLRTRLKGVYDYMLKNKDIIMARKPQLYARLTTVIPNLEALDETLAPRIAERLDLEFDPFVGDSEVSILGARLYHKKSRDIRAAAAASDFVIAPTRTVDDTLPLVLRNNFNGQADHFVYIDKEWDSATPVYAGGIPVEERKLPDTSIVYPFLTTGDLLSENLVELCAPVDSDHFFDGNLRSRQDPAKGYLLPLKPLFFKYFNAADLMTAVQGRPMLDMEQLPDGSVTVTLRVPLKKRYIELTRNYYPIDDPSWTWDERRATGRLVRGAVMNAAVFPFVRTTTHDDYTVQLFAMLNGSVKLDFRRDGLDAGDLLVHAHERSTAPFATTYYDVSGDFDFIEATVELPAGTFTGYMVPRWKPYVPAATELIFAVDFGTTNTHVEWAERGHASRTLTFAHDHEATLVASLLKPGSHAMADQVQRVEFLPRDIDEVYGFPLRSALASNHNALGGTTLFGDVNVPFLYERQYFSGYDVTTNLKWSGNDTLAREFLRELVLLIKARVLLENADLARATIVYFYPVSMGGSDRRRLTDTWNELFRTYIGDPDVNLRCYPESMAPAFFYRGADVMGGSYVSIDIGGGTTDVVVYQPTADRLDSEPVAISSFRFAGDALFGDAFTERDADNNPLIAHYAEYFRRLIARNGDIAYLDSILESVLATWRSQDVNAFLFSIENVEQLRALREVDRNLYSYNTLLRNDNQRKVIFAYFYAAIIYYIAQAMHARGLVMPKQVYFSGTGSKILRIVGPADLVTLLTQRIFEGVFEQKYGDRFELKIERDCPKQITCRGGIKIENERRERSMNLDHLAPRDVVAMKYCHSMVGREQLTYDEVNSLEVRAALIESVKRFNAFFTQLLDAPLRDELGIDNKVFALFSQVLEDNLDNYLTAGIAYLLKGRYDGSDVVEDVPFFYPIMGAIRHNLLKNLCNQVLSKL